MSSRRPSHLRRSLECTLVLLWLAPTAATASTVGFRLVFEVGEITQVGTTALEVGDQFPVDVEFDAQDVATPQNTYEIDRLSVYLPGPGNTYIASPAQPGFSVSDDVDPEGVVVDAWLFVDFTAGVVSASGRTTDLDTFTSSAFPSSLPVGMELDDQNAWSIGVDAFRGTGTIVGFTPIPEPSVASLCAVSTLALALLRHRRGQGGSHA